VPQDLLGVPQPPPALDSGAQLAGLLYFALCLLREDLLGRHRWLHEPRLPVVALLGGVAVGVRRALRAYPVGHPLGGQQRRKGDRMTAIRHLRLGLALERRRSSDPRRRSLRVHHLFRKACPRASALHHIDDARAACVGAEGASGGGRNERPGGGEHLLLEFLRHLLVVPQDLLGVPQQPPALDSGAQLAGLLCFPLCLLREDLL